MGAVKLRELVGVATGQVFLRAARVPDFPFSAHRASTDGANPGYDILSFIVGSLVLIGVALLWAGIRSLIQGLFGFVFVGRGGAGWPAGARGATMSAQLVERKRMDSRQRKREAPGPVVRHPACTP